MRKLGCMEIYFSGSLVPYKPQEILKTTKILNFAEICVRFRVHDPVARVLSPDQFFFYIKRRRHYFKRRLFILSLAYNSVVFSFRTAKFITFTASADHRVIDGAVGAQWMKALKANLEDPANMIL